MNGRDYGAKAILRTAEALVVLMIIVGVGLLVALLLGVL